jgi:hypothetical protein
MRAWAGKVDGLALVACLAVVGFQPACGSRRGRGEQCGDLGHVRVGVVTIFVDDLGASDRRPARRIEGADES